jgi:hypothetical protein
LDSAPAGFAGDCFYVMAMYSPGDGGLDAGALFELVARENAALGFEPSPDRGQVRRSLHGLAKRRPPLMERLLPSRRWRLTAYGHVMLRVWCGEDDEPAREPCGLGWPV